MIFDNTIQNFIKERNEVLLSFDEQRIRTVYKKYGVHLSTNPDVFWGSIHKAITAIKSLPKEIRQNSKKWLNEKGWESMDDGDLK